MNIYTEINQTPHGIIALNILKTLHEQNHKVYFHPLTPNIDCPPKYHRMIEYLAGEAISYDRDSPCLKISPLNSLRSFIGKGKHCCYSIPDISLLSPIELEDLMKVDVGFSVNKNIPGIKYVPVGVDRKIFNENIRTENNLTKNPAVKFLVQGKWSLKNGHDILISAFEKAFESTDNILIIINCLNPYLDQKLNDEWLSFFRGSKLASKIVPLPRFPYQTDLAELYSSVDCGVFYSRTEGAAMSQLEMLSCGKTIIQTTCPVDFLNSDNSLMIDCSEREPAFDGQRIFGSWNKLDEKTDEQLITHLRNVYKSKLDGLDKPNEGGIICAKGHSWAHTTSSLLTEIEL
jgi:glycosyltransferase involved in cell wall biosynthesis